MDQAEKDKLLIKKEALLTKKRLIDAIDLLREKGPSGNKVFNTNCFYLTDATKIHHWPHFKNLLDSFSAAGVASFKFDDYGTIRWGDMSATIELTEKFDEYAYAVRSEFYSIDKLLKTDEGQADIIKNERKRYIKIDLEQRSCS